MLTDTEKDIQDRITAARGTGDVPGMVRGLRDLQSIGWGEVRLQTRSVGRGGERLTVAVYVNREKLRVFSAGSTRAFRLVWLLRYRAMIGGGHHMYLKHKNEMSAEEREWVEQGGTED
jgi:hypothetical protein